MTMSATFVMVQSSRVIMLMLAFEQVCGAAFLQYHEKTKSDL